MKTGDYCRAKCNAPARYLTDGLCLWVSSQSNDLCVSEAGPKTMEPDLPTPSEEEVFACLAGLKHGLRTSAEDKQQRDASEAAYELVCRALVGEDGLIFGAGAMAIAVKLELKQRDDAKARVIELETWVKKAIPVLRKSMRILRVSDFTNVGEEAGKLLLYATAIALDDQEEDA